MANQTQQLTVADLVTARMCYTSDTIAANCIKLVEEMVKLEGSTISDCEWHTSPKQKEIIAQSMNGNLSFGTDVPYLTREYVCQLNNLRLKAVAAFGGEVK